METTKRSSQAAKRKWSFFAKPIYAPQIGEFVVAARKTTGGKEEYLVSGRVANSTFVKTADAANKK